MEKNIIMYYDWLKKDYRSKQEVLIGGNDSIVLGLELSKEGENDSKRQKYSSACFERSHHWSL